MKPWCALYQGHHRYRAKATSLQFTTHSEVMREKEPRGAWKRRNPKAKIISEEVKSATHIGTWGRTAAVFIIAKYEQLFPVYGIPHKSLYSLGRHQKALGKSQDAKSQS